MKIAKVSFHNSAVTKSLEFNHVINVRSYSYTTATGGARSTRLFQNVFDVHVWTFEVHKSLVLLSIELTAFQTKAALTETMAIELFPFCAPILCSDITNNWFGISGETASRGGNIHIYYVQKQHLVNSSNIWDWCVSPHSSPTRGHQPQQTIFNILNIFIIIR